MRPNCGQTGGDLAVGTCSLDDPFDTWSGWYRLCWILQYGQKGAALAQSAAGRLMAGRAASVLYLISRLRCEKSRSYPNPARASLVMIDKIDHRVKIGSVKGACRRPECCSSVYVCGQSGDYVSHEGLIAPARWTPRRMTCPPRAPKSSKRRNRCGETIVRLCVSSTPNASWQVECDSVGVTTGIQTSTHR